MTLQKYLIESPRRECILSTKHCIEVVCPEVVADEREDCYPDICFDPVLLRPGLVSICLVLK